MITQKKPRRRCSQCKEWFYPSFNLASNICSPKCQASYNHAHPIKRTPIKVNPGKAKAPAKPKEKSLGQYEIEAKNEFQKWVRMRDHGKWCISCGKTVNYPHGGHFLKAELYSGLIFHPDNCHSQCKQCNIDLDGNLENYRIGLIERIGFDRANWIELNKDRLRFYKFSKQELITIKKTYKALQKDLL